MESGKQESSSLSQKFKKAQLNRETDQKKQASDTKMVTQDQLAALESQRRVPQPTQQLTPGGEIGQSVNKEVESAHERKIAETKRKLSNAKLNMNKNFGRVR